LNNPKDGIPGKMPQNVSIVVDDRETRSRVMQALRAVENVSITMRRLDVGDYEVDGRLLVERKTLLKL
jgi:DNA excision repair protein ERCC-4